MFKLCGLYAITDATLTPDTSIMQQVAQAIAGGVRVLQFRDKNRTDRELVELTQNLQQLCTQHKVCFILNDRLALAKQINADGLHIGQHDLEFTQARAELPNKILGMSCYGNVEDALKYQALGADYVAFGACFNSPTKPLAKTIDLGLINAAKQQLNIPVCAIGGITLANAPQLIAQNVDLMAVISDLWLSSNITQHAQTYADLFANNSHY